jgi:hypothetical protein
MTLRRDPEMIPVVADAASIPWRKLETWNNVAPLS